ncbi:MAG TPA: hypothetical protein VK465_07750 [Fibrobacteria bacterium]|nr:hypothetical protein [Fibrobacteria bacterium]
MFGLPLHPTLVHFPIVLAVLMPVVALAFWVAGRRFGAMRKFWSAVVILQVLLFGSAFLAVQSGGRDEERVEKVLVSESPLESHEEKAEVFLWISGAAIPLAALGLAPGILGLSGQALAGLASLAILFAGFQAGHTGGQLVYQHGAAAAYVGDKTQGSVGQASQSESGRSKTDDDDD